jgi:type IV pilus assembly protein PilP
MYKKLVIIGSFIFICSLWAGCDEKATPPTTSRKITKKITIDKKDASKPQLPQKTHIPKSASEQTAAKPMAKDSPNISKGKVDDQQEKRIASGSETTEKTQPLQKNEFYNPRGKLDPFAPLIKEKPVTVSVNRRKTVHRRLLTPLEKLDLSQLKLVAIFRTSRKNEALVEEDSGKGYIVKKGTYIGTNGGRVTDILPNKIIIEEEVEDIYGKTSFQKKEIELKPPGEE